MKRSIKGKESSLAREREKNKEGESGERERERRLARKTLEASAIKFRRRKKIPTKNIEKEGYTINKPL